MNINKGINVSEWQGNIDWGKGKPKIDFTIIRPGFGKSAPDPFTERNIAEYNRLGTTWQVLAEYNKLDNPNLIYAGQKIKFHC